MFWRWRIFAQSSERFTEDKGQLKPAFDEADAGADESAEESEEITCRRRRKGREPIAPHIPREEVIHQEYGACLCRDFAEDESSPQVIIAPKPARLLPGSIASSGLLSYIMAGKFCDGLLFYRRSKLLERSDIHTETAKANDLNPQRYLQQVFKTLPLIAEGDIQSRERLLPWNIAH